MTYSTGMTIAVVGLVGFLGSWIMCVYYMIRMGLSRPATMTFFQAMNLALGLYRMAELTPDGRRYLKRALMCMAIGVISFIVMAATSQIKT